MALNAIFIKIIIESRKKKDWLNLIPYLEENPVMTLNCQFGHCHVERKSKLICHCPYCTYCMWHNAGLQQIFATIERSKAARFVSVPVLPTVVSCECKEEKLCFTFWNTKRPEIWRDKLKKQLEKVESSSCAIYCMWNSYIWTAEKRRQN